MNKTLIIGATSAIAIATARLWASDGDPLYLVARDVGKLEATANDLKTRGSSQVEFQVMDVLEHSRHLAVIEEATARLGGLDRVLIAHGTLPDQAACQADIELSRRELEINCLSTFSLLTHLANLFESKGSGTIAVLSSVAGDRGRQSNYLYGTAKGALSLFLQGLRNRLYPSQVNVITIKPGFVDTPMTDTFPKGLLWAQPERVAADIYKGINKGRDIIYTPFFWRYLMWVIKAIPEPLFKRLSL
ncbi:MAG: SDR family oxidoreductase [Gammaproteobacteria bacterium]|nr:SDR family oxidoreductase [Gammaproteobacteria bacterium]